MSSETGAAAGGMLSVPGRSGWVAALGFGFFTTVTAEESLAAGTAGALVLADLDFCGFVHVLAGTGASGLA